MEFGEIESEVLMHWFGSSKTRSCYLHFALINIYGYYSLNFSGLLCKNCKLNENDKNDLISYFFAWNSLKCERNDNTCHKVLKGNKEMVSSDITTSVIPVFRVFQVYQVFQV